MLVHTGDMTKGQCSKRYTLLSVSAEHHPFLYFDLYLNTAYAAHYVYFTSCLMGTNGYIKNNIIISTRWLVKKINEKHFFYECKKTQPRLVAKKATPRSSLQNFRNRWRSVTLISIKLIFKFSCHEKKQKESHLEDFRY